MSIWVKLLCLAGLVCGVYQVVSGIMGLVR